MSPEMELDIYHLIKKYDDWLKVPSREVYLLIAKLWEEERTEFTQIMLEQDLSTFDDKKKIKQNIFYPKRVKIHTDFLFCLFKKSLSLQCQINLIDLTTF